jgi:serine/threonine protein kinase
VHLNDDTDGHILPQYLREKYSLGPILGKGGYAYVREGAERGTNNRVAVKILSRAAVKPSAEASIRKEVHILSILSHPNIVRTFAFYEEPDYFYTVLECINGGALFDRLKLRTVFTELQVRELALVLLSAIQHCHDKNVVHRCVVPCLTALS